ncbi:hypothetical protein niasHT_021613 [Heterodera trifolii]|uniref:Uncharacterized protein n=1 Tax=Heterodera trifolii TaxID=157864 RepID=A0ABD2JBM7_9BILA
MECRAGEKEGMAFVHWDDLPRRRRGRRPLGIGWGGGIVPRRGRNGALWEWMEGQRVSGNCPYCRRPAFAEDAVPTPRWTTLTTQHNQHMPNEADEKNIVRCSFIIIVVRKVNSLESKK